MELTVMYNASVFSIALSEFSKLSLFDMVSTESERNGELLESLLLVLEPKDLIELLYICTLIEQGTGRHCTFLETVLKATSIPAPRALVACAHLISGSGFVQMKRPQMALVCFRKAFETDSHCVSALYQSMLIYRQLGNKEAEIKALELLHSVSIFFILAEFDVGSGQLVSSSLLLSSPSLKNLLTVPSALTLLHSLALRCVLHGRSDMNLCSMFKSSVDVPVLPRLADLYLETAAALLMVQRPADCIALCDEVVGTTLDLLPERFELEESDLEPETVPSEPRVNSDKGATVLWVGAAHLLQGHCHIHLKDWKQAITHYTRCIDLLVKVQFKNKDMGKKVASKLSIHQRLKAFSFAGRGICFSQTGQLKEALRDLQLSLHAFPGKEQTLRWCGEVLWRLERRHEAASCWKNFPTDSSKEYVSALSSK
uniref:FA complementation group G n=1 Tax=Neogobius melanostomus TaxID=47308 RepID=A0A8C6SW10_9GOBI